MSVTGNTTGEMTKKLENFEMYSSVICRSYIIMKKLQWEIDQLVHCLKTFIYCCVLLVATNWLGISSNLQLKGNNMEIISIEILKQHFTCKTI